MNKVRVRIQVTEWQEFDVDDEWFDGEVEDTPEALYQAVADLYTNADPGLAWEAVEDQNTHVVVTRVDTGETAEWRGGREVSA